MAVKVAGTPVIGQYYTTGYLRNITDANGFYGRTTNDSWDSHAATAQGFGGSTLSINFSGSLSVVSGVAIASGANISLNADQEFSFGDGDASPGDTANILVDRDGNQLSFGNGGTGQMTIYWEDGSEPDWNSWRYWHIFGVCIDSDNIRCSAIPWTSTAASYPTGTFNAQVAPQLAVYISDTANGGSGTTSASAAGAFNMNAPSASLAPDAYINAYLTSSSPNQSIWYDTGGSATTLQTSSNPAILWYAPNNIPSVAFKIRQTAPSTSDTGWVTATAAGTVWAFSSSVSVNGSGGSTSSTENITRTVEFYIRANGYADALVATFKAQTYASASASCFEGSSLLTTVDESGNFLEKVALEDFHTTYHADTDISRYVKGQDGITNRILEFRRNEVHCPMFGFNGSDNFVTGAHPFLTTTGWKCIHGEVGNEQHSNLNITDLEVGHILIKYNSDTGEYYEEELTSITTETMPSVVYSLDVTGPDSDTDGNDTYIVDDYVVHNK